MSNSSKSLGKLLKNRRLDLGLTLRTIEEATNISNAYLSMLENDKITKPSASTLHTLSEIYRIPLQNLLESAGIIKKQENLNSAKPKIYEEIAFKLKEADTLTDEEAEVLLNYLRFIRNERKI